MSSNKFQSALNEELQGLNGVYVIADDILIVGKGDLLKRCVEKSIKLNKDKIKRQCKEVPYMGSTLKPDATKIKAITEMPLPTDVKGV